MLTEKDVYMDQQKADGTAFDPTTYYDPFEFVDMASPGTSYYVPTADGQTGQVRERMADQLNF